MDINRVDELGRPPPTPHSSTAQTPRDTRSTRYRASNAANDVVVNRVRAITFGLSCSSS